MLDRVYRQRLASLKALGAEPAPLQERNFQDLAAKVRGVEREQITRLRAEGRFRESTLRDLERELDLLDLRWEKK
jgi:hypothetical protein